MLRQSVNVGDNKRRGVPIDGGLTVDNENKNSTKKKPVIHELNENYYELSTFS